MKKECCQQEENLSPPEPTGGPRETMRRCKVCQCRHFTATIDPMHLGIFPAKKSEPGRKTRRC